MSPWKAERLFTSSPHLASYVQRLSIAIPPPRRPEDPRVLHIPARPTKCYPPLQAVLPAFARVQLVAFSGPETMAWTALPTSLRLAMQAVISLPSVTELQLTGLRIPASLIAVVAPSVPKLSLSKSEIDPSESDPVPAISNAYPRTRSLTLDAISKSMTTFLGTPCALPNVYELFFRRLAEWSIISAILAASAPTLTRVRVEIRRRHRSVSSGPILFPRLHALRVLELDLVARLDAPSPVYDRPDLSTNETVHVDTVLDEVVAQLPRTTPLLERATIRLDLTAADARELVWVDNGRPAPTARLAHLQEVHCRLCFLGDRNAQRRDAAFAEFVRIMRGRVAGLCDAGALTFSHADAYRIDGCHIV
ncbi:hypothetical protein DFH07DRAFT_811877 [Mycena maculata]|uniref:Uncharacterized protein n=1 Tax=Mycena maculata TaxID=230809 RepID=A0AAD7NJL6_9AGAR|nr:hypothetical protein DFH07DRAFT_811877 [Mycena maculata]